MNKIYNIKNQKFQICCDPLYENSIKKRLLHFENKNYKFLENYHIFKYKFVAKKNYTCFKCKKNNLRKKSYICRTDEYVLLNNMISNIINDNNNIYIHSSVISKNGEGVLILGDFGAGKTTMCLNSTELDYEINSADQSWIKIEDNKMFLYKGSKYMKYNDDEIILDDICTNKNVEINKILFLDGVSNNGKVIIKNINSIQTVIKKMYRFCIWHTTCPIFTDLEWRLYCDNNQIIKFLNKIEMCNINSYIVRGDCTEILRNI